MYVYVAAALANTMEQEDKKKILCLSTRQFIEWKELLDPIVIKLCDSLFYKVGKLISFEFFVFFFSYFFNSSGVTNNWRKEVSVCFQLLLQVISTA